MNYDDIKRRVIDILNIENITFEENVPSLVAELADGGMRDALSILERCVQDGANDIDEDKIKELVGIPKLTYVQSISESIIEYNIDEAMESITKVLDEGKDLNTVLSFYNKTVIDTIRGEILDVMIPFKERNDIKIDDLEKNIKGAEAVGIKGYLFDGDVEKLRKYLERD